MNNLGKKIEVVSAFIVVFLLLILTAFIALDARFQVERLKRTVAQAQSWSEAPASGGASDAAAKRLERRMLRLETDVAEALKRNDIELERRVAEKIEKVQLQREEDESKRRYEKLFRQLRPDMQGFIGAHVTGFEADVAAYFGIDKPIGALVVNVIPLSPAEKAGVQVLDLITRVNDQPVEDAFEFQNLVRTLTPGSKARLEVLRMRQGRVTLTVDVGKFSEWVARWEDPQRLALRINALERQIASLEKTVNQLGLKLGKGAIVPGRPFVPPGVFEIGPGPEDKDPKKADETDDDALKEW